MAARRRAAKRVAITRAMTRELGPAHDVIVSTLLGYAEVIDDPETRPGDRLRALAAWLETFQLLGERVVDEERRSSQTWGGSGLQAV